MTELLAPAGDFEKLDWAIAYGADAVYFGAKDFSLRSYAGNFTLDQISKAITKLHSVNKKGYVTLNIYPFSSEYENLIKLAKELESIGVDALIVSDLGVISELKNNNIKTPIHLSTQANTLSYQTVNAYKDLGIKRVNLARELSFDRVKQLSSKVKGVELEVFVHGSVCFSYSGRCAISDYMTGRSANRGECTHPCRWNYALLEEKRPGEYYPVSEDERGLYFFNSKDLALYRYVQDLKELGIHSLKIEGRMKTIHYLASIISFYRAIIDGANISDKDAINLLSRVSTRGYSEGFFKGSINKDDYKIEDSMKYANSEFLANTISYDARKNITKLRVRNRLFAGEELEVLSPGLKISKVKIPVPILKLSQNGELEKVEVVHNESEVLLNTKLDDYSILRRIKK